jgi:hypothetical protein
MRLVRIALLLPFATASLFFETVTTQAQAIPTASKSAEISAFGGYMPSHTDYGPHTLKGFEAGADFTIFPHFPVAPSLEVRGQYGSSTDVTEKALLLGIRVQKDFRFRLHPYADFLIGIGQLTYHLDPYPNYSQDTSKALSYGGGINLDVSRHLSAKLDIQAQNWNFGKNGALQPNGNYTLTPYTAMVGVTYTVPFRVLNRHSDFH